jgi:hypothetical protein
MPLARIITSSVDDSLELSMQLRARGFEVEMVAPDQVPETPVDLEVLLEECAPEDVLNKAAQIQESEDLWVFVAPGALDERGRPMRRVSTSPQAVGVPAMRSALRAEIKPAPIMAAPEPEEEAVPAELTAPPPPSIVHAAPTPIPYEMAAKTTAEPMPTRTASFAEPTIALPALPKTAVEAPTSKVKVVVLPKPLDASQIPEIPARSVVVDLPPPSESSVARKRTAGPYKIAFRTGPAFGKRAAVSGVLVVLLGLLAAVVGLRPSLPTASKPVLPLAVKPVPKVTQGMQPAHASKVPAATAAPSAVPAAAPVPTRAEKQPPASTPAPVATGTAQKAQHPPGWVSDRDLIAEDTVVFYDRKSGKPGSAKTAPGTKRHSAKN